MIKATELLQNGNSSFQIVEDDGFEINPEEFNSNCLPLSIRCSAHTLQLVVHDVLNKIEENRQNLEKIRSCAVKLRTQKMVRIFKKNKKIKPILDTATRWSSTFYMIRSLIREEDFLKTLKTTQNLEFFTEAQWEFMHQFVAALSLLEITTQKLQVEDLTFGDFYKVWLECKLQLTDIRENNMFASSLCLKMKERESKLFENDPFCSAIYLDQRFNFINSNYLSSSQKHRAIVSEYENNLSKE